MANGVPCKKCGWQEAEHDKAVKELVEAEDRNLALGNYTVSLQTCRGYVPETKEGRQKPKPEQRKSWG